MRAMVFHEPGGPDRLRLEDLPVPEIGPTEVLIKVAFCGVNPVDRSVIGGTYQASPMPHIAGSEISGIVSKVGEMVSGLNVGDRVALAWRLFDGTCKYCSLGEENLCLKGGILGVVTQGGYAEFVKAPAVNAIPLPEEVSLEEAAAVTLSVLTAWHMVYSRAKVRPAETVLVVGASGGVGSAAVQLAKMAGAYVIAVAGGSEKVKGVKDLEADEVIDRTKVDFSEETLNLTGGLGADVVIDPVGASTWSQSFASVARNGRWTTVGVLTGAGVTLSLASLYSREVRLIGSTGGTRQELRELLNTVARAAFEPVIWKVLPLEQAPQALKELESADRIGKVLLKVSE